LLAACINESLQIALSGVRDGLKRQNDIPLPLMPIGTGDTADVHALAQSHDHRDHFSRFNIFQGCLQG